MIRFHTQTGGVTLQAQQPEVNIIRVALQGFAAVCGGTQSLHTNGFDEALALPTERSARIALRTQQVLAYESGAADTVDPFAGSYFIESLTDEIEKRAWELIDKVERARRLGSGSRVHPAGDRGVRRSYHERYRTGQDIVVGVNKFVTDDDRRRRDPAGRPRVRAAPAGAPEAKFKESRDAAAVEAPPRRPRERSRRATATCSTRSRTPCATARRSARCAGRCGKCSASTEGVRSSEDERGLLVRRLRARVEARLDLWLTQDGQHLARGDAVSPAQGRPRVRRRVPLAGGAGDPPLRCTSTSSGSARTSSSRVTRRRWTAQPAFPRPSTSSTARTRAMPSRRRMRTCGAPRHGA